MQRTDSNFLEILLGRTHNRPVHYIFSGRVVAFHEIHTMTHEATTYLFSLRYWFQ